MSTLWRKATLILDKEMFSADRDQAKRKAIRLYRLWYRSIPYIKHNHLWHLPVTKEEIHQKLRSEFYKNKDVKDLRIIDMLIHNSRNDLKEIVSLYAQQCHIMGTFFKDTVKPKPNKFLEKFFSNTD